MAPTASGPGDPSQEDADPGLPPSDLAAVVFSGVLWKAATRGVASVTRVVVVVTLARLLTPEDLGLAGMALVVASFIGIFTDPALGAALIQRPTIDERDRSTVFWTAVGIGALLTVLGIAMSGLVADFFGEAEVRDLFVVTSLTFVIGSLSVAHRALLARRLAYRSLEIREMISVVVGGAIAIAAAVSGFGAWAVVANSVAYVASSTLLVWVLLDWRPSATFSLESARNLVGFSTRIFAATILSWGNQNLDKALVGRFVGAAALGAYSLAYSTMFLPMTLLGRPFHQVLTPAFSRIQRDKARLEWAWIRSKRMSVAIVAPGLVALLVTAPDFIPVVFGGPWDEAVVPLQLLCVGGLANTLTNLHWSVLQARGEAGSLLRMIFVSSALTWTAFAAGLYWGIVGVAALYAVARWVNVLPSTWMTTTALVFDFRRTLRAGLGMLLAAIAAGGIAFAVREALDATAVPQWARLVLVAGTMASAYVTILLLFAPTLARDVQAIARRRSDSAGPGPLDS
jgi:O-antigen/teichoic acid export membrane protein